MIHFILNEKQISTNLPAGMTLLDFIRYHQHLMGTKIGCREGDCGACTVLVGEIVEGHLRYTSATCCLMPLGNSHNKHIVTIEGINTPELNPIQQAMADHGATQCGFCTPGFVMSLAGFCLSNREPTRQNVIAAIDGNICRCTGYKSIERAAERVADLLKERKNQEPEQFVANEKILPSYFSKIKLQLEELLHKTNGVLRGREKPDRLMGGGTDLYVQKHDEMKDAEINFLFDQPQLNGISESGNICVIGPAATATDIHESEVMQRYFPAIDKYLKLISSTPIRNMATLGGNFINASPIGDFTIFFLAIDAQLTLRDPSYTDSVEGERDMPLRKLYNGYKQLNKKPEEYIEKIWFEIPRGSTNFNFEKVSKRTHLDIASVNSAMSISMDGEMISNAGLSAGGVGPVPMYLSKTSAFLKGMQLSEELITQATEVAQTEISPISDARGSEEYKRFLLNQLIKAHFLTLFPELEAEKLLNPLSP